ncbi:MAG: mobile mystery protein A [Betaproteobacteria bacterium]|nr:mobile mystery protein A [Betaproteobacteria bacterium]MDH4323409.1 mobile mystery protein A [Betaproteobacteria bacterium]
MTTRSRFKTLTLDQLDESLATLRKSAEVTRPPKGWARSIREALGMSLGQLAQRVGVSRETIATLERSEARGTITLASLEKLARGLNCRVTYALVPEGGSLEGLRRKRAQEVAQKELERVSHSMRLEAQGLSPARERRQLERQVQELLASRRLWD